MKNSSKTGQFSLLLIRLSTYVFIFWPIVRSYLGYDVSSVCLSVVCDACIVAKR